MAKDFAKTFKTLRLAAGLTQQCVADQMLIPKRTIQDWEGEKRTPPPYVQRFVLNELRNGSQKEEERSMLKADLKEPNSDLVRVY